MKRIWESETIILTGFRVQDPVPEPPALVRKSVKPEVPGTYVRGVYPFVTPPSPVRGEMQPLVMPSPLFGEGGYGPYLLISRTVIAGPL